jgi:aerobic-type carbon monoxide dehydrogenase small subunit (CoxS/CutS family)
MPTMLTINGRAVRLEAQPDRPLLSVLRDDLDLTGAKYGCGEGQCGACTVLIDGKPTRSCITELGECEGKQIATIEGLAEGDRLHPLQQAFLDCGAMQCGYCTPGMILAGVALLEKTPQPSRPEIAHALNGNMCRCGTYQRIIQAVEQAAAGAKGGVR